MDLSLENIYKSWFLFRRGKRKTAELEEFSYYLENNLSRLEQELKSGVYRHGGYRVFAVTDNKRREIKISSIKDRVVHRLVYEYLKSIYDQTFIFDVWSCREDKGLVGAVNRTQEFLRRYADGYVWRADVKKFFDSVNQATLWRIIKRKIKDSQALNLIQEIIFRYFPQHERERERE